jgi:hypothetical protein
VIIIGNLKNNGLIMTALEQLYKHLEVNDPKFWNAQMILDWAKENKQRFLDKEQEQLHKAWKTFNKQEK